METYKDDLGGTDETILEFVYKYLDNPEIDLNAAMQKIVDKTLWIVPMVWFATPLDTGYHLDLWLKSLL